MAVVRNSDGTITVGQFVTKKAKKAEPKTVDVAEVKSPATPRKRSTKSK